ncbi:MAG TPA: glycoside hydrolase family 2 TIM barrel-domain containing protein [Edaphobacter sp.]
MSEESLNTPMVLTADEHPCPQFRRESWSSLNGAWDFHIDGAGLNENPEAVTWDSTINVPFSPETKASGVANSGFYSVVWYRQTFVAPALESGEHLVLHFEAVDYQATVWVNGAKACQHQGGYTPFSADVTAALRGGGELQEIIVRAEDDPADLTKPRGKQAWRLERHSIWYPRTTGIWQTVWLERVPPLHLEGLQWTSSLARWEIGLDATIVVPFGRRLTLAVKLMREHIVLATDTYEVVGGEVHRRIALSDPGIDDYRNDLLWSPDSPTLIDAFLKLWDEEGRVIDEVQSYTALRAVKTQGDKFILNGRPLILRLVLDQGYWPDSGLTAPSDQALVHDVLLAKVLGFNGVRKHQKIECRRYLYWADRMGLLVWEEMPSAYRYTTKSVARLTAEWTEVIRRDSSHPCIIAWVPFNESWGVPDLPDSPAQQHYVKALYHLTKSLDSSRPVIGNDGWESIATDIIGIHDYDDQPERIGKRYGINDIESELFKRERPGGRMLFVGEEKAWKHPIVLTEFGGIALGEEQGIWGYSRTETSEELVRRYSALLETVRNLPALAGFCYTQLTDTYQEANGLVYADRTPKAPFEEIAKATTGGRRDRDTFTETAWREHLMHQRH